MTYPVLNKSTATEALNAYRAGDGVEDIVEQATTTMDAASFDPALAIDLSNILWEVAHDTGTTGNRFERRTASLIHERLALEPIVAGDPGFWRWLTFAAKGTLMELVDLRYGSKATNEARDVYFGLGQAKQGMFNYLWLCGGAVFDPTLDDPYELTYRGDVDFWQSHIVRIDFGSVPQLARALVRFVYPSESESNLSREEYRDLAKEITRRNPAMSFELLDDEAALELVEAIWRERDVWRQ